MFKKKYEESDNGEDGGDEIGQKAAYQKYAEDITNEHIYTFIDFLKYRKVEYMVAPYEADSQLAYLYKTDEIQAIMTEDSDLIAYNCYNIIRQVKKDGKCRFLNIEKEFTEEELEYKRMYNVSVFTQLTDEAVTKLCILAGCDYLQNLKSVGFGTLIRKFDNEEDDADTLIDELIEDRLRGSPAKLKKYKNTFEKVCQTFMNQVVYDKLEQRMVYLSYYDDYANEETEDLDIDYVGDVTLLTKEFALGLMSLDDHFEKRPKTNRDFERMLKFFEFKPDMEQCRINNLAINLVTFENFDKPPDSWDGKDSICSKRNEIHRTSVLCGIDSSTTTNNNEETLDRTQKKRVKHN